MGNVVSRSCSYESVSFVDGSASTSISPPHTWRSNCRYTVIVGWRRAEDEEDIWEGTNFNLYEFIKSGKEVPFDDFTEEVLDNLTYQYPSSRWEKGLGDDCEFLSCCLLHPLFQFAD